jgi:hypothetical protein
MSFLFFLRFLSDFFWETKIISIMFIGFSVFLCAVYCRRLLITSNGLFPAFQKVDFYLCSYFMLSTISFLIYGGEGALEIYVKLTALIIAFYTGKVIPAVKFDKIYFLYIPIFILVLISLVTGGGFQYWGNIKTFSGGYFYKTDLAIALTIFSMFIAVSALRDWIKLVLISVVFILIFLSNSRMYLLLFSMVLIFYYYRESILKDTRRFFVLIPISIFAALMIFVIVNAVLQSAGMLAVDYSDLLSGSNMQGRDLLWGNLIAYYGEFPIAQKLFGFGLVKDVELAFYTGHFESTNSHNTFIYNLISVGVVGSVVYLLFFYEVMKRIVYLFQFIGLTTRMESSIYIAVTLLFLFMIASMTATVVIFLQLSWFVFFFIGYLYNCNINK